MEVVPAMGDSSPFQHRDVAEWSHMDRLTGMMETARVETDRWAASTPTTAHSYGKVVDSRNRSLPDGSAQQRQRQQLEVFQTKGPTGSLQVIRTQSVTSTNSSWRGTSSSRAPLPAITQDFGNLQLTLNPLDLSSEKSKGSVGRSGSIGGRRPPSRPRSIVGKVVAPLAIEEDDVSSRLAQVSRICQQVHDDAKKTAFKTHEGAVKNITSLREFTSSTSSRSGSDSFSNGHLSISRKKSTSIEDLHNGEELEDTDEGLKRSSKVRRSLQFPLKKLEARGGVSKLLQDLEESNKRNSSEGRIARKSFEALENVLKRGNNKYDSLNKESEDSESSHAGNEENGEINNKHVVNNVSLDSFSKKFNRFSQEKRHSSIDASDSKDEFESSNDESKNKSPATKRHSFVTVESLKEVRGRLKRLNSPLDGLDTESGMDDAEDHDDGIGTDESAKRIETVEEVTPSRVKSYVYGMESNTNRQPVLGTGSLESRTSNKSSINGTRSDEWYNRRKSYGFEKVTSDQTNDSSSTLSSKADDGNLQSTDSGICRSSETFNVPSWNRKAQTSLWDKTGDSDVLSVSHSIQIKPRSADNGDEKEIIDKRKMTVVSFGSKNDLVNNEITANKVTDVIRRNFSSANMLSASLVNGVKSDDSEERGRNQHVTVSIPIVQEDSSPTVGSRRLFYQQLAQGTTLTVEKSTKKSVRSTDEHHPTSLLAARLGGDDWWMKPNRALRDYSPESKLGGEDWRVPSKLLSSAMKRHSFAGENSWKNINGTENSQEVALQGSTGGEESWRRAMNQSDTEMKRHSIAVDELKYVHDDSSTSMTVAFAHDVDNSILKKHKKVEFCKTEVHFAAEPGRFNIVETDEKPPSTNMFRRRRRPTNPTPETNRSTNLPEVRFGDSIYEKHLLGGNEEVLAVAEVKTPARPTTLRLSVQEESFQEKEDQVFTQANATIRPNQEEEEEHNNLESSLDSKPRSILKNFSMPQPYLLGQEDISPSAEDDDHDEKWGVRLRPVARDQTQVWKSTVTVSSRDAVMPTEYSGQSELQKLLRSLRPANQRKHDMLLAARYSGTTKTPVSDWSVAERVRHVEQVATESKGFSTRVNFGGGEATVLDEQPADGGGGVCQRLFQSSDRPKPVWQRREEAMMASDEIKHLSGKRKPLVVQIGQNGASLRHSTNLDSESPQRRGTTTKITIDLSPSPTSVKENQYPTHEDREMRQNGVLHSPSLIMKTINCPDKSQARRSSLISLQEKWKNSSELHSSSFLKGGIRSYVDNNKAWTAEYNSRTNGQTNVRRLAMGIGDRGIADGEGSPITKTHVYNGHHWGSVEEKCCDNEVVVTNSRPKKHNDYSAAVNDHVSWRDNGASERGSAEEVVVGGQLDAWRALYCDIDSELSDDSEKADEEVRSYMSTEGEGGSSEISGSWSRATALRHFHKQEYTAGYSVNEPAEDPTEPKPTHSSVATAVLPSYGESSRLRAVETLVSTRSGQPKITSISLRYDGDQHASTRLTSDSSKFTSRTTISPERRHSSYNEGDVKSRPDNVSSTFLEPAYKSQTSLFSPKTESNHERNGVQDRYSARGQVFNGRERLSFSDKLDSENRKELSLARMQPAAKLTSVTSEPPVRTFTSMLSAFEKQQFNNRRSSSPPASSTSYSPSTSLHQSPVNSTSSSRVLSSFEHKISNSSSSRRSQSPATSDLPQQTSNLCSKRSPSPPANQRNSYSESSEQTAETRSSFARRHSQEKLTSSESRHRDKSSTLIDAKSRVTTTQVESEIGTVTKALSQSPIPTKMSTTLSKNSLNKDFIGRVRSESPVHLSSERSSNHSSKHISSGKPASLKDITDSPIKSGSQSPVYQNRDVYHSEVTKSSRTRKSEVASEIKLTECGLEAVETDSAILEELTRAADQILQAVNGYTDEDSRRVSSDDDRTRRAKERRVLGTIVEAPTRKQTDERRDSLKMNGNSKRLQRTSSKTKLGPTSSTSSVESITRETRRTPAKTSTRTARMVQRASSRELLLQAHASSSEDIASGTESTKPRAPPPRRSRTSSSGTKTAQTSPSKSREKKKETTETSRTTKERSSVSRVKSRDATVSSHDSRRKTPETKQYPVKEKTIPAVNSSMSGRDRMTSSRTTTTRTKKSASSRHDGAPTSNKTNK